MTANSHLSTRGRLLDAGERLLADGHGQLTLDAVAAAAGVSRTTAYRVFGSNAEMAGEVAVRRLEAHRRTVTELGHREEDVISRVEALVVYAVGTLIRDPGLRHLTGDDDVRNSAAMQTLIADFIVPLLEQGQTTKELRQDVEIAEITDWLVQTTIAAVRYDVDEHTLRRRFRLFVRPALLHVEPDAATAAVVTRTKRHLDKALELLDELPGTIEDATRD